MHIRSNYYGYCARNLAPSLFLVLLAFAFGSSAGAATVAWTNLAGGNWSAADNWSPNQVPGPSDSALITSNGVYTVTLDVDVTVGSLTLGGSSGTQRLENPGSDFTLNGASQVSSNGVISLSGGILEGSGLLTINGQFNWSGGRVGPGSALALGSNGVLVAQGAGFLDMSGVMTNAGIIRLTSGIFRCIAWSNYGGGYGLLVNAPGGLIDFQADVMLDKFDDASGVGAPALINQGTVRKSAGSGSSSINTPFYNSGTLDVQSGTVVINGGGSGGGVFQAGTGATVAYPVDYEVDGIMTGSGTNLLSGGVFTLKGSIAGQFVWSAGIMGANTSASVATNGVLLTANNSYMDLAGVITNAGIIRLTSGILRCIAWANYGGGYGLLVNAQGGLIDFQADVTLDAFNDGSGVGAPTVINRGTVRKSGGSALSGLNPAFLNSGTLDVQTGTLSLAGGGSGNGIFQAAAGATLDFAKGYQMNSALTGQGTNSFSGGNFFLNGSLNTSNAVLTGSAVLGGTNGLIADALTWTGGQIGVGSTLTLATNAVLTADGSSYLELSGILTNAGTIILTNGIVRCIAWANYGGGYGLLVNSPGGLIDFRGDVILDAFNDGTGTGAPTVINRGTVRKSSGSGTGNMYPAFFNLGLLDARSGNLSVNGTYDLTGGTLNFGLRGPTNFGTIHLTGSAALTGTVSATLLDGFQPVTGDSFAVLTYGSETGIFTNAVLPFAEAWQTNYDATVFSLQVVNVRPTLLANAGQVVKELTLLQVTNVATDLDVPPQTLSFSLVSPLAGMHIDSSSGIFTWTPDQTQSPATNTITVVVTDNGSPPLSATNSFQVVVQEVNVAPSLPAIVSPRTVDELALLTVTNTATNFNIHSSIIGYGLVNPPLGAGINASGIITWTPSKAQSPHTNTLTTVVTNANPYDQINPRLTATNSFTVIIYAPTLAPISNQLANAGQAVALTASATDNDSSRTLTYDLVTAPAGATITPTTGQFSWRPPASSAGSSNYVQVRVTANHSPPLTDVQGFGIVVNPIVAVALTPLTYASGQFKARVAGPTGPDYVFMVSSNLSQWTDLVTNAAPTPPFQFTDPAAGSVPRRLYRVRLSP